MGQTELNSAPGQLYVELWASLASLLRSYTAVHGLNRKQQAAVEWGEERIVVRYGEEWLDLRRVGATVSWKRADGQSGVQELAETGRLRSAEGEEEMDLAAVAWARELMR